MLKSFLRHYAVTTDVHRFAISPETIFDKTTDYFLVTGRVERSLLTTLLLEIIMAFFEVSDDSRKDDKLTLGFRLVNCGLWNPMKRFSQHVQSASSDPTHSCT